MALELEVIFKSALPGVKRSRKLELIAQWGSGELQGTVVLFLMEEFGQSRGQIIFEL